MGSRDNRVKANNGQKARRIMESTVTSLRACGFITDRIKRPTYGYEGYDQKQFYVPEVVTLVDGKRVALYSTNSFRSDRLKEQQWDAANIKMLDPTVTLAWLIVPSEKAFDQSDAVRQKIRSGSWYSSIDDVLTVDELNSTVVQMEEDALQALLDEERRTTAEEEEADESPAIIDALITTSEPISSGKRFTLDIQEEFVSQTIGLTSNGARRDAEGRTFERVFAATMDNDSNLERYNGSMDVDGYHFELFTEVMDTIGLNPNDVSEMSATNSIEKLPGARNPKTDVLVTATTRTGRQEEYTFSLKSTNKRVVSVHEYSADCFADVLNPDDLALREALEEFQAAGSARAMGAGGSERLTEALRPYHQALDEWAFSGVGFSPSTSQQIATYLVAHNKTTNEVVIHNARDYCAELEALNKGRAGFGTIFHWTYPSKRRGERIQLKADVFGR